MVAQVTAIRNKAQDRNPVFLLRVQRTGKTSHKRKPRSSIWSMHRESGDCRFESDRGYNNTLRTGV